MSLRTFPYVGIPAEYNNGHPVHTSENNQLYNLFYTKTPATLRYGLARLQVYLSKFYLNREALQSKQRSLLSKKI
ncbi:MAG TPA: hypothetical protein VK072_03810 [Candidatus Avamphibacillus sp.]|nr:hypothetical protein [Candidatus Avamphibacillus sp.]